MSQQEKLPLIKEIHSIQAHNETINQISIFPSGNLISVSYDCTIKIWDKNLNILQKINQEIVILCVSIKDNNNFVICTNEIQIWSKNNVNDTLFKLKEKITKIQNGFTNFILYCSNDDLIGISCHFWVTVYSKVKNKNIHQSKITLIQNSVDSLLLLEKDNILIICGRQGLYFWNSKIWEQKKYLHNVKCIGNNSLYKLNNDIILCGGINEMKIISISQMKIIQKIKNQFLYLGICSLNNKNIILCVGESKDIIIYKNNDDYKFLGKIVNTNNQNIRGIFTINNDLICTYSNDKIIKIFKIIS